MSRIPSALSAIAKSKHPAVRAAKRLATPVIQRMDIVMSTRLPSGDVLYVDLANSVGRWIWLQGDYKGEGPIKELIESTLSPGDVFFDVGANVGFFSLVAARKVGESGDVHSFEPNPQLASLLRRTVAANHLANLHVVEAAVGQRAGVGEMAVMKNSGYSHMLGGAADVESEGGRWHAVSVKTLGLDDYVARSVPQMPRLLKMDIEGAEVDAIDGAQQLFSNAEGPDVICEVGAANLARFSHEPNDVFARFASMGYESFDPETRLSMDVADLTPHRYNVFFKKRSR
jgi:FkbM family methyltransferase